MLACVVTLVYLSARTKYTIVKEMESGAGKADFIFYPNDKGKPAFILELKKNSTPAEALKQIKEKRYATVLKDYTGQKLAVGISYDEKLKKHSVKIEDITYNFSIIKNGSKSSYGFSDPVLLLKLAFVHKCETI